MSSTVCFSLLVPGFCTKLSWSISTAKPIHGGIQRFSSVSQRKSSSISSFPPDKQLEQRGEGYRTRAPLCTSQALFLQYPRPGRQGDPSAGRSLGYIRATDESRARLPKLLSEASVSNKRSPTLSVTYGNPPLYTGYCDGDRSMHPSHEGKRARLVSGGGRCSSRPPWSALIGVLLGGDPRRRWGRSAHFLQRRWQGFSADQATGRGSRHVAEFGSDGGGKLLPPRMTRSRSSSPCLVVCSGQRSLSDSQVLQGQRGDRHVVVESSGKKLFTPPCLVFHARQRSSIISPIAGSAHTYRV